MMGGWATLDCGTRAVHSGDGDSLLLVDDGHAAKSRSSENAERWCEASEDTIPPAVADDVGPDRPLIPWARHVAMATNGIICAVARCRRNRQQTPLNHTDG